MTGLLARPAAEPVGPDELVEAWAEAAARLGLVRLGWARDVAKGVLLAYPTPRAVSRSIGARPWLFREPDSWAVVPGTGELGGLEERILAGSNGVLVASAAPEDLPGKRALRELATLADALWTRRELHERMRALEGRSEAGRRAAAAGHDLRNELTRALLHSARGAEGDAAQVMAALHSARDLAQASLLGGGQAPAAATLQEVDLRAMLVEEARAASTSARVPDSAQPRLRVRCAADQKVLALPTGLGRAVRNLVTNAMEACARSGPRQGTVGVVAAPMAGMPTGHDLMIEVQDDGDGMDGPELRSLLDPGRAAHASSGAAAAVDHGKPASTGLGTESLRAALRESGLGLRVESTPGAGTRMQILLRRAPVDGRVRLVVDPDRRRVERVRNHGAENGQTVWGLANAQAALCLLRSDLVESLEVVRAMGDPCAREVLRRACERAKIPFRVLSTARMWEPAGLLGPAR